MAMIDMSAVPVPDIIELPDFEQKYSELKNIMLALDPSYEKVLSLESDPAARLLQVFAYRELHLIAKINNATRANVLASSEGNDLEGLASRYDIERLTIQRADNTVEPPVPEIKETDEALRRRAQMAFDGLNTAGSIDGYIFYALGADGRVRDADAQSPHPTEMVITLLSHEGTGAASDDLLVAVRKSFGINAAGTKQSGPPSKVRPQGDRVTVQSAEIISYSIDATLSILPGPDPEVVRAAALAAVTEYASQQHRLGSDITRSGIYRALHQPGVNNVTISDPASSIAITPTQAPYCTAINVRAESVDE